MTNNKDSDSNKSYNIIIMTIGHWNSYFIMIIRQHLPKFLTSIITTANQAICHHLVHLDNLQILPIKFNPMIDMIDTLYKRMHLKVTALPLQPPLTHRFLQEWKCLQRCLQSTFKYLRRIGMIGVDRMVREMITKCAR